MALEHEHIIKLYVAFEDEKNVYMVQEFAGGGDLWEELRRNGGLVKEKYAVRDILAPFLNALCYMHSRNVVHRDIKPENLLLSSNKMIKVADFGLSIDCSSERPVTRAGTLDYMVRLSFLIPPPHIPLVAHSSPSLTWQAPEVLICPDKKLPEENKSQTLIVYGHSVDAWAIGILAYELLVGCPPFEQEARSDTYDSIMYKEPRLPSSISSQGKNFILAALNKNAEQRPSVLDLIRHPWIQQYARPRHLLQVEPSSSRTSTMTQPPTQLSPNINSMASPQSMHRLSRAGNFNQPFGTEGVSGDAALPVQPGSFSPFASKSFKEGGSQRMNLGLLPSSASARYTPDPDLRQEIVQDSPSPETSYSHPSTRRPPPINVTASTQGPAPLSPMPANGILSDESLFSPPPPVKNFNSASRLDNAAGVATATPGNVAGHVPGTTSGATRPSVPPAATPTSFSSSSFNQGNLSPIFTSPAPYTSLTRFIQRGDLDSPTRSSGNRQVPSLPFPFLPTPIIILYSPISLFSILLSFLRSFSSRGSFIYSSMDRFTPGNLGSFRDNEALEGGASLPPSARSSFRILGNAADLLRAESSTSSLDAQLLSMGLGTSSSALDRQSSLVALNCVELRREHWSSVAANAGGAGGEGGVGLGGRGPAPSSSLLGLRPQYSMCGLSPAPSSPFSTSQPPSIPLPSALSPMGLRAQSLTPFAQQGAIGIGGGGGSGELDDKVPAIPEASSSTNNLLALKTSESMTHKAGRLLSKVAGGTGGFQLTRSSSAAMPSSFAQGAATGSKAELLAQGAMAQKIERYVKGSQESSKGRM